jgi:tungstate transport system ATP-binding protein
MNPIYQLSDISKAYNGRTVLDVPELAVERGEILVLIGPSGAGKTTLLRLLNFLERPTTGTVVFDGRALGDRIPLEQRRRVTAVYEQPALLGRSVTANINYGLGLRKKKLTDEEMAGWLERLGLAALARQSALKLSAGEAQRVAMARALVLRPDVLLLDEPTNSLDPYNVSLIERLVLEEQADTGMTVVMITHDIFQARRLAHRVGLMLNTKLIELADATTFFDAPSTKQAAAFLRGELVY